jgi:uncharacterized protein (TIGR02284 family)
MAAARARDAELKALFQAFAEQRAEIAAELQGELALLGAHAHKSGTVAGALHQGWTQIKSAVTGGSDKALIAECERGEEVTSEHFEEALGQDLPPGLQALVRRQLMALKEARDRIRALEVAAQ